MPRAAPGNPGSAGGIPSFAACCSGYAFECKCECGPEVLLEVIYVLKACGHTNQAGCNAGGLQFSRAELRVCGRCRMGDARFGIAEVDESGGELDAIEEGFAGLDTWK